MATLTQPKSLVPQGESFQPSANGWNVGAASFSEVSADALMDAVDINDSTLTISTYVEYTNDANGSSGWAVLVGSDWAGGSRGPGGRIAAAAPHLGPYQTSAWPAFRRLRVHTTTSRAVNLGWTVTAT